MKNSLSLMIIGAMFAGSVMADTTDQQKREIEQQVQMNERAARQGGLPDTGINFSPLPTDEVIVRHRRDIVGMELDDPNQPPAVIGSDHILEMNDTESAIIDPPVDNPLVVNGRAQ